MVETSARHVHLSEHDFKILFGEEAELTARKNLSQPGQYACYERVDIVGPKDKIQGVTILGPLRGQSQIEISLTDSRKLGIEAPIRDSGEIENTPGCILIGPKAQVSISKGVIVAKRHIHIDPEFGLKFNLKDKQNVKVKIHSEHRSLIFDDVTIRIDEKFSPAMHIDTDEANSAGLQSGSYGEIIAEK